MEDIWEQEWILISKGESTRGFVILHKKEFKWIFLLTSRSICYLVGRKILMAGISLKERTIDWRNLIVWYLEVDRGIILKWVECENANRLVVINGCLFLLGNKQLDALFHVFIYLISLHVSSITVLIIRRTNCINTSSGMISLCKWLLGMPPAYQAVTYTD